MARNGPAVVWNTQGVPMDRFFLILHFWLGLAAGAGFVRLWWGSSVALRILRGVCLLLALLHGLAFLQRLGFLFSLDPGLIALVIVLAVVGGARRTASETVSHGGGRRAPVTDRMENDGSLHWAGTRLPDSEAAHHFLVLGSTGSGKTLCIRRLMQDAVAQIAAGAGHRVLVYDAKAELYPVLCALNRPVHLLHPFDQRSVAWDIAADIVSPADAFQLASSLIASENSGQPFWSEAARHLVSSVVEGFQRLTPGCWTLRDLLLAFRWPERTRALLNREPATAPIWDCYSGEDRTLANLFSTLSSKLRPYEVVAALWHQTKVRVSLADCRDAVWVLGEFRPFKTSLDPINQLLLNRLADQMLSQPDMPSSRTWLILDEVRELPRFDRLHSLLNQGRSKNCRVVLGAQDIEGLREVYGERVAHEMLGQCGNQSYLRTSSAPTARWVEEHFGQTREVVLSESHSYQLGRGTTGYQLSQRLSSAVLASDLLSLPRTGPKHGLHGFHDVASLGAFRSSESFESVLASLVPPKADCPGLILRPAEEQQLEDWCDADAFRLRLPREAMRPSTASIWSVVNG